MTISVIVPNNNLCTLLKIEDNIDNITKLLGMNITFVTTAQTDEEGFALLREFGLPFKK